MSSTSVVKASPHVPQQQFYGISKLSKYQVIKQLGQGTFGIVYKGRHLESKHLVAIKRILSHKGSDGFPVTAFREITILKTLRNINIIELIELIFDRPPKDDNYTNYDASKAPKKTAKAFYMVFPYMSYDLTGILGNPDINLKLEDIKSIMIQLFKGINFIHDHKYLHRDIKASNILINFEGVLKIGDFGLARKYEGAVPTLEKPGGGDERYTEVVMTRWYRAPEVLFGERKYTTAVDLWGIGCVFGELFERKPILSGKSDLDQVYEIFKLVGEPNQSSMPGFEKYSLADKKINLSGVKNNLEERFSKTLDSNGLNLLRSLLKLDPFQRITGKMALKHPFFASAPLPNERVETTFEECHEADVTRFKETKTKSKTNLQHDSQHNNNNNSNDNKLNERGRNNQNHSTPKGPHAYGHAAAPTTQPLQSSRPPIRPPSRPRSQQRPPRPQPLPPPPPTYQPSTGPGPGPVRAPGHVNEVAPYNRNMHDPPKNYNNRASTYRPMPYRYQDGYNNSHGDGYGDRQTWYGYNKRDSNDGNYRYRDDNDTRSAVPSKHRDPSQRDRYYNEPSVKRPRMPY